MKQTICAVLAFLIILSLCGCAAEDPNKAAMQALAGENLQITGDYDKTLAAVCRNGTFVGQAEGDVIAFKGVPFAAPPVGALRWKPPVPAAAGNGVYEAKYFGKSPIQTEWVSEVGSYYPQSEDCLTLNVWTNAAGPREGKAVMVFFHGGSYGWGATSDPIYDGHNLVEKYPDLVLVTVEYRLGIFGFIDFSEVPGGEAYAESGNLGLLDQICALEWVQENIAAFGGDPGNVTIFGESAGAGSVSLLPLIGGTDGLFRRIIAESGSVALTYSREECRNLTQRLLEKSGCADMEALTSLSEETLIKLNEDLNDYNNFPERDGVVLPEDLYAAWENDSLADIDVLIGTNSDEARYWIKEMGYYTSLLPGRFLYELGAPFMYENNMNRMSTEERALAKSFIASQSGRKIWRITEFFNEVLFRVPALEQVSRHKGKSYNYYWTMAGADETLGACHAMELSYVFNNPQVTIYTGGRYNEALADTVQEMWVNFARTGDPSTETYAWEPYTADSRKTMVLGEETGMADDLKQAQRETLAPLLRHYFNGCYSQLDFFVPQLGRIVGTVLLALALVTAAVVILCRRKRKKRSAT